MAPEVLQRIHEKMTESQYEEVIFGVLVSKLKLSKISTCFTCLIF